MRVFTNFFPFLILGNAGRQAEMIQRKQEEYQRYVDQYFATKDQDVHQDTYRYSPTNVILTPICVPLTKFPLTRFFSFFTDKFISTFPVWARWWDFFNSAVYKRFLNEFSIFGQSDILHRDMFKVNMIIKYMWD